VLRSGCGPFLQWVPQADVPVDAVSLRAPPPWSSTLRNSRAANPRNPGSGVHEVDGRSKKGDQLADGRCCA